MCVALSPLALVSSYSPGKSRWRAGDSEGNGEDMDGDYGDVGDKNEPDHSARAVQLLHAPASEQTARSRPKSISRRGSERSSDKSGSSRGSTGKTKSRSATQRGNRERCRTTVTCPRCATPWGNHLRAEGQEHLFRPRPLHTISCFEFLQLIVDSCHMLA